MKYIDADQIRAEIERRKELLTPHKGQGVILCREIIKQFDSLLSFIDTISQPIMKNEIIGEIRAEIERRFSEYNHDSSHHIQAAECASILDFLDTLQEQPVEYPTSTEMIAEWENNELPMLREKDFRGDAERMAYNAFLDGFAKGLGYRK